MMMQQIWRRLQLMVGQGELLRASSKGVQAKVLEDEVLDAIKRVEPYGLSYRPKPGAQVYVVFPNGDRSQGIALLVGDKRYQLELQEGEVALHDDQGQFAKLGHDGVATVKALQKVLADAPLFETTGDCKVGGALHVGGATTLTAGLTVTGAMTNNGKNVGSSHTHDQSGAVA